MAPALPYIARAETYPSRPVRLIIGYLPGGSADMTARLFGQWLSDRLGQQVVVESRAGASTNIATEAVVRAAPDGYTLLLASPANATNAALYDKLNFEFSPRCRAGRGPDPICRRRRRQSVAAGARPSPN